MKIFLVEDERILRVSLSLELTDAGHTVYEFSIAKAALLQYDEIKPDLVITDIRMPEMDGIELLSLLKESNRNACVVVMTAHSSLETAIEALKLGAYDYLVKPFQTDEILHVVAKINELNEIKTENRRLQKQICQPFDFSKFIGSSIVIRNVFETLKSVINSNASILITGETGTGKELIANIIHYNSNRSKKPFIKVSCAILAKDVFESELFGHEKGAFTGAEKSRQGRFAAANQGTIYLDDIDDIPIEMQVKLLRVLQEREVEPVGATHGMPIDVRVISSTKYNIKELVAAGKFREDLFYRLNVIPINIPPLRERREDIPLLAQRFLSEFIPENQKVFSATSLEVLQRFSWPGNVRELKNMVERLSLIVKDSVIETNNLPAELFLPSPAIEEKGTRSWDLEKNVAEIEIKLIRAALDRSNGNKSHAAQLLGLPLSTFRAKAAKYEIE